MAAWATGIAVAVGVSVNFWRTRTIMVAGGIALIVFGGVAPETLAVLTPVLTVATLKFGSTKAILAVPALVCLHAVLGVFNGRMRFLPSLHGPIVLLGMWLIISYRFAGKAGLGALATDSLLTALLALGLCAAAGAMLSNRAHLLMALTVASAIGAVLVRMNPLLSDADAGTVRLGALNLNPNGLGMLLAWGILASIALVVVRREPLWLLPGALCASSLPLAKSRGSLLILAVGILAMVLFRRSRRVKVVALLGVLAVLLLLPNAKQMVVEAVLRDRADNISVESDTLRKNAGIEGFRAGLGHPVIGLGWSRFPEYAESTPRLGLRINTHDVYAKLFAETGAPGLLLYMVPLLLALRAAAVDDEAWACKAMACAFLASGFLANLLVERTLSVPMMLLLGATAGHDLVRRERERSQDESADGDPGPAALALGRIQ